MRLVQLACLLLFAQFLAAQTNPAITAWKINADGKTGFGGFKTNVQQVQFSTENVYVSTTNIADWIPVGYDWPNNPWFPEAQNFVFKITLHPTENTANKILTPYGHIGIWTNGVSIYNPKDAKSWKDSAQWFQNAFYFEHVHMETFDDCLGHPNNMHEYHTHVNPKCLYDETDSSQHSPIIGFAFDGFPIYGAYGFANADGTGGIRRMISSYRKRSITSRQTLPNGTQLPATLHGPSLNLYPLGAYIEDFEFVNGLGTLDRWNGRFCKTPDYPDGTYAYFVTLDEKLEPAFPYVLGPRFFGTVQPGNLGPNSGHNVISEPVQVFVSANDVENELLFKVFPNPASTDLNLFLIPTYLKNMRATLLDARGRVVEELDNVQTAVNYSFQIADLPAGFYFLKIEGEGKRAVAKISIQR